MPGETCEDDNASPNQIDVHRCVYPMSASREKAQAARTLRRMPCPTRQCSRQPVKPRFVLVAVFTTASEPGKTKQEAPSCSGETMPDPCETSRIQLFYQKGKPHQDTVPPKQINTRRKTRRDAFTCNKKGSLCIHLELSFEPPQHVRHASGEGRTPEEGLAKPMRCTCPL